MVSYSEDSYRIIYLKCTSKCCSWRIDIVVLRIEEATLYTRLSSDFSTSSSMGYLSSSAEDTARMHKISEQETHVLEQSCSPTMK